ncbi:MAG: ABC transporter [Legionellales bacterium RIFCSPHIGHO2_12_FULL_35_11]|nr:MAG: ABC transporter [Legionellales bacterium RIFCSPHIGHO2_12_FULL_35_11]
MRYLNWLITTASLLVLQGCIAKGPDPRDPYEKINRKIYAFNVTFDKYLLKPPAEAYVKIIPSRVRAGINNVYNNVNMLPTFANDVLQADLNSAIKDFWRFVANSTIGIGGIFDPASTFSLPPHSNDLGLTFAKWGDKNSPYIMIPFLGPSTIRDGMGLMFDCALFTPYPYIEPDALLFSILGLRYVDLRSQMLDTDKLISMSLDKYSFIRDAYLQHRNYLITGESSKKAEDLYIDEDEDEIIPQEPENGTPSKFPLTTASLELDFMTF